MTINTVNELASPAAEQWRAGCITGSYNPDAEPSSGYTPLPAGEYQMEIVESDYVPTAKGTGMILKCKAQIVGGEYEGRPFYINYDLEHRARTKQERGQRDFAGLRRATGVLNPEDSEELHFKTFGVKIGVREDTGANIIRRYLFDTEAPRDRRADWQKAA